MEAVRDGDLAEQGEVLRRGRPDLIGDPEAVGEGRLATLRIGDDHRLDVEVGPEVRRPDVADAPGEGAQRLLVGRCVADERDPVGPHRVDEAQQGVVGLHDLAVVELGKGVPHLGAPVAPGRIVRRRARGARAARTQGGERVRAVVAVRPLDDDPTLVDIDRDGGDVRVEGERVEHPLARGRVDAGIAGAVVAQPQVVQLTSMAVIPPDREVAVTALDPAGDARCPRIAGRGAEAQPLLVLGEHLAGADADALQSADHGDEAVVPQCLELADRSTLGLLVGLHDEPVEQLVGELGDVGQPGPRPLQRRAELGHEVAHARFPTGHPVDEEGPHRAPAQAGAEADGVVDLADRGDAAVDQPQRLAPQRLEEAVGHEAVDLDVEHERAHADRPVGIGDTGDDVVAPPGAGDDLDQRQQVDRVERMPDDEPLRMDHALLQARRQQPRRRRGDDDLRPARGVGSGEQALLDVEPLRRALLDQLGTLDGLLRGVDEGQLALVGQRRGEQPRQGAAGVGEDLADLARRVFVGVVEAHVGAVEDEAGRPPAADHAAAEQAHPTRHARHGHSCGSGRDLLRIPGRSAPGSTDGTDRAQIGGVAVVGGLTPA